MAIMLLTRVHFRPIDCYPLHFNHFILLALIISFADNFAKFSRRSFELQAQDKTHEFPQLHFPPRHVW